MSVFMIDVSVNNGNIDWKKVKNAGVGGAMIKATQGHAHSFLGYLFTDSKFKKNITEAYNNGIMCGAYHWLTARTIAEAEREAAYFISAIAPYKSKFDLFAAVDVEDDKYFKGLSKDELTKIVHRFCEIILQSGFVPIIYTNRNYLNSRLNKGEIVSRWKIWQAHWSTSKPADAGDNLLIWQNEVRGSAADVKASRATVIGSVDGVKGAIDCNIGYFKTKEGATWKPPYTPTPPPIESHTDIKEPLKKGDKVRVVNNIIYGSTGRFKVYFNSYEVLSVNGNRVVIGKNGVVTAAVDTNNLERI